MFSQNLSLKTIISSVISVSILLLLTFGIFSSPNITTAAETYNLDIIKNEAISVKTEAREGQLVFGEIEKPGEPKVYSLNLTESENYLNGELTIELLLPPGEDIERFNPKFALVSKRNILQQSDIDSTKPAFEFQNVLIPTRTNINTSNQVDKIDSEFIPEAQATLTFTQELKLNVESGNNYHLVVSEPNYQTGEFLIAFNQGYQFSSWSDLLEFKTKDVPGESLIGVDVIPNLIILLGASLIIGPIIFLKLANRLKSVKITVDNRYVKPYRLDNIAMLSGNILMLIGSLIAIFMLPEFQIYQIFTVINLILLPLNVIGWKLEDGNNFSKIIYIIIESVSYISTLIILLSLL